MLLQTEQLQTFDKTWLPARLQAPRPQGGVPYGVYLAEYEQYLVALQHMKASHMRLTRRDPRVAAAVSVRRSSVDLIPREILSMARSRGAGSTEPYDTHSSPVLSFGSAVVGGTVPLPSLSGSEFGSDVSGHTTPRDGSVTPAFSEVAPSATGAAPEAGAAALSSKLQEKAARKRAKRLRQRKARSARALAESADEAELRAAHARAKVAAAKAEASWTRVQRRSQHKSEPTAPVAPKAAVSSTPNRKERRRARFSAPGRKSETVEAGS